ncbi:MAG: helix-turn-helix domain-containing protein [Candidatus Methanomethylophilaceae archaeon]|jgi:predicted transcriptional regulator
MNDIDVLLSMIENPNRRKILTALVKEPQYPLRLSKELGISQQAVMKNLNILEKNGMVVSYQESSLIGPMRTVYEPSSEFTIVIDMRNSMFSTRMIELEAETEQGSDEFPQEVVDLKETRKRISNIDKRIEELDKERSKNIREKEKLITSVISELDDTRYGYDHRKILYEMMNEPDRSLDELSEILHVNEDTINHVIEDVGYIMEEKRRGGKKNDQ